MCIKQLFHCEYVMCFTCGEHTEHVLIDNELVCLDHAEEDEDSIRRHNEVIINKVLHQL